MDLSKLQGKQWLYAAFGGVITGLLSLMWKFFPILLIIAGLVAFLYWTQKFGKKKPAAPPQVQPPTAPLPPTK